MSASLGRSRKSVAPQQQPAVANCSACRVISGLAALDTLSRGVAPSSGEHDGNAKKNDDHTAFDFVADVPEDKENDEGLRRDDLLIEAGDAEAAIVRQNSFLHLSAIDLLQWIRFARYPGEPASQLMTQAMLEYKETLLDVPFLSRFLNGLPPGYVAQMRDSADLQNQKYQIAAFQQKSLELVEQQAHHPHTLAPAIRNMQRALAELFYPPDLSQDLVPDANYNEDEKENADEEDHVEALHGKFLSKDGHQDVCLVNEEYCNPNIENRKVQVVFPQLVDPALASLVREVQCNVPRPPPTLTDVTAAFDGPSSTAFLETGGPTAEMDHEEQERTPHAPDERGETGEMIAETMGETGEIPALSPSGSWKNTGLTTTMMESSSSSQRPRTFGGSSSLRQRRGARAGGSTTSKNNDGGGDEMLVQADGTSPMGPAAEEQNAFLAQEEDSTSARKTKGEGASTAKWEKCVDPLMQRQEIVRAGGKEGLLARLQDQVGKIRKRFEKNEVQMVLLEQGGSIFELPLRFVYGRAEPGDLISFLEATHLDNYTTPTQAKREMCFPGAVLRVDANAPETGEMQRLKQLGHTVPGSGLKAADPKEYVVADGFRVPASAYQVLDKTPRMVPREAVTRIYRLHDVPGGTGYVTLDASFLHRLKDVLRAEVKRSGTWIRTHLTVNPKYHRGWTTFSLWGLDDQAVIGMTRKALGDKVEKLLNALVEQAFDRIFPQMKEMDDGPKKPAGVTQDWTMVLFPFQEKAIFHPLARKHHDSESKKDLDPGVAKARPIPPTTATTARSKQKGSSAWNTLRDYLSSNETLAERARHEAKEDMKIKFRENFKQTMHNLDFEVNLRSMTAIEGKFDNLARAAAPLSISKDSSSKRDIAAVLNKEMTKVSDAIWALADQVLAHFEPLELPPGAPEPKVGGLDEVLERLPDEFPELPSLPLKLEELFLLDEKAGADGNADTVYMYLREYGTCQPTLSTEAQGVDCSKEEKSHTEHQLCPAKFPKIAEKSAHISKLIPPAQQEMRMNEINRASASGAMQDFTPWQPNAAAPSQAYMGPTRAQYYGGGYGYGGMYGGSVGGMDPCCCCCVYCCDSCCQIAMMETFFYTPTLFGIPAGTPCCCWCLPEYGVGMCPSCPVLCSEGCMPCEMGACANLPAMGCDLGNMCGLCGDLLGGVGNVLGNIPIFGSSS
ncbi:unnamed protein product [Amoebophrya sp. A120]|nr:unnamed protein product [Amoebophrya sp. A120]|eukprot:GSA120T00005540001.1